MIRISVCLLLIGCNKVAQTQSSPKTVAEQTAAPSSPKARPHPPLDACALITNEEVGAIQSATILEAKSNETSDGVYLISQCYYAAREANMSVSFALTEPNRDNPAGAHPREYWERTFDRPEKEKMEEKEGKEETGKRGGREEEEEKLIPKKIEGVGEEAFWAGNRFGGALYVLNKDMILRISVGGPDKEEAKINRSKTLAEKAISRF